MVSALLLTLRLVSGEIREIPVRAVSGFHRPLNGEAANLMLTIDRSAVTDPDWSGPHLGAQAEVTQGSRTLLSGMLARVVMDRTTIQAGIEG